MTNGFDFLPFLRFIKWSIVVRYSSASISHPSVIRTWLCLYNWSQVCWNLPDFLRINAIWVQWRSVRVFTEYPTIFRKNKKLQCKMVSEMANVVATWNDTKNLSLDNYVGAPLCFKSFGILRSFPNPNPTLVTPLIRDSLRFVSRGVDKANFWRDGNPDLPTEKTSLKPNLPTEKAFLVF